jgi:hypothetical protein
MPIESSARLEGRFRRVEGLAATPEWHGRETVQPSQNRPSCRGSKQPSAIGSRWCSDIEHTAPPCYL